MATKKKQHFVSQFLMRHFSVASNTKIINLYNRETNKLIQDAPINSQAQESYFYGEDAIFEDYLSAVENRASPILKRIVEEHILPDYKQKDYEHLHLGLWHTEQGEDVKITHHPLQTLKLSIFNVCKEFLFTFKVKNHTKH